MLLTSLMEGSQIEGRQEPDPAISNSDLISIHKIKKQLEENYQLNFPSIQSLSRAALMSDSKFKKLFRKVHGASPFEYYQRYRMWKARHLIQEGQLTVSQIGILLGYQNLSNFSASFKKEFAELPSNILKF